MTLTELAPKSADEVADFKHWARKKYGGLKDALYAMDSDRNGKLTFNEFRGACELYGFGSTHLKLIFQCMDTDGGGVIEAEEVKWLDKWDPPQYLYFEANEEQWDQFRKSLLN